MYKRTIEPLAPQRRIYANTGNSPLIALLGAGCGRVLDVGCGAGDNASLVKARNPEGQAIGITHSVDEAELVSRHLSDCAFWILIMGLRSLRFSADDRE